MKNRITTHFYVKEARKDIKGFAPIYLRITVNGQRGEISTNRKITPSWWDKSSERAGGRSETARTMNSFLDALVAKVGKYFSSLDVLDNTITASQIITELKGIFKPLFP